MGSWTVIWEPRIRGYGILTVRICVRAMQCACRNIPQKDAHRATAADGTGAQKPPAGVRGTARVHTESHFSEILEVNNETEFS